MRLETNTPTRWMLGLFLPLWFALVTFGPVVQYRNDLPDPIATHFRLDGAADGSMSLTAHLLGTTVVVGLATAVLLSAVWVAPRRLGMHAAVAVFVGQLVSALSAYSLAANAGVDDWRQAEVGPLYVLAAASVAFAMAVPVARDAVRTSRQPMSAVRPTIELSDGERAAWFGRADSAPMLLLAWMLVLVGVGVLVLQGSLVSVVLVVAAVPVVVLARVEVSVSNRGVIVRSGVLGWIRLRFPLTQIDAASSTDLAPRRWGGWGYRGSVRLFGRGAWVVRGGDALVLSLAADREFAVTVDDADGAAAVVNGLLARPTRTAR